MPLALFGTWIRVNSQLPWPVTRTRNDVFLFSDVITVYGGYVRRTDSLLQGTNRVNPDYYLPATGLTIVDVMLRVNDEPEVRKGTIALALASTGFGGYNAIYDYNTSRASSVVCQAASLMPEIPEEVRNIANEHVNRLIPAHFIDYRKQIAGWLNQYAPGEMEREFYQRPLRESLEKMVHGA